jgi:hypothetical protein
MPGWTGGRKWNRSGDILRNRPKQSVEFDAIIFILRRLLLHLAQIATLNRGGVTDGEHTRYCRTEFEVQLPNTTQYSYQPSIPAAQCNWAVFAFGPACKLIAPYLRPLTRYLRLIADSRINGAQP